MKSSKSRRQRGVLLSPQGWQKLQKARREAEIQEHFGESYTLEKLSERTGLDFSTVARVLQREAGVDKRTLERFFSAFHLELDKIDYFKPDLDKVRRSGGGELGSDSPQRMERMRSQHPISSSPHQCQDWGMADVSIFYGREEELNTLEKWLLNDRCRLVALLGMGGIGKTALAAKLVEQIKENFEYVQWRSLLQAPPVHEILANLIHSLSNGQENSLPETLNGRISLLITYLSKYRCLLVLDNAESILSSGEGTLHQRAGFYREGYEGYGELFRRVGEAYHQSCLLFTSREKPKELASLEGEILPVRSLRLSGLKLQEGQAIFQAKGLPLAKASSELIKYYDGNPLALKLVATAIQDIFDGNVEEFLNQRVAVFGDIHDLLDQQFNRLSDWEKSVMYWLAINRELVSLSELQSDIKTSGLPHKLINLLESLGRRMLIERTAGLFSLQPVVMEYVTNRLIEQAYQEIVIQKTTVFNNHALMKATAPEYIKATQIRLILKPLVDQLLGDFKIKSYLEEQLTKILTKLRAKSPLEQGYAGGNIFNMLCHLETNLSSFDFSQIMIWQADMRNVELHNCNFSHADLTSSVFASHFGDILSVALSPDNEHLAVGDTNGQICLWQIPSGKQLLTFKGHTGWVRSVSFSADGRTIVSSSSDHEIKLWDAFTGQCLKTLQEHTNRVRSVAFNFDGRTLVSGSDDQTVKLWDVSTGQVKRTLQGHTNRVRSVIFSLDGQMIASGGDDGIVKLWDVNKGNCIKTISGHRDEVWSVALSPDNQILASGGASPTVKLWDVSTGQLLRTLQGHSDGVWSVAFSPDQRILASAGYDQTVKLWDISTGQAIRTLQGHTSWVRSIAFGYAMVEESSHQSPQRSAGGDSGASRACRVSRLEGSGVELACCARKEQAQGQIVSGGADRTVRLWDVSTGQVKKTLRGHSNGVWSVAFSPNGDLLASASDDQTVRLWDISTEQVKQTLRGHSNGVWSVAFSPNGDLLASASDDQTVRLWDISTGQVKKVLHGHTNWVWSVAFSPIVGSFSPLLASGSVDCTVRLWNVNTGQVLRILVGHLGIVRSVTFNRTGQVLASSSVDCTVRLWDVNTSQCLAILPHPSPVSSVSFSADGQLLASGSDDGIVRLWDVSTSQCIRSLHGHTDWVQSVAFSHQGYILASGSHDQTVKLWDASTGQVWKTLQGHTGWVWSVAFRADDLSLASSSQDETIKLWNVSTSQCLRTLRSSRIYEGMDITGATGLTEPQKATLKALGAVELSVSGAET